MRMMTYVTIGFMFETDYTLRDRRETQVLNHLYICPNVVLGDLRQWDKQVEKYDIVLSDIFQLTSPEPTSPVNHSVRDQV